jgi:hypothetical protein
MRDKNFFIMSPQLEVLDFESRSSLILRTFPNDNARLQWVGEGDLLFFQLGAAKPIRIWNKLEPLATYARSIIPRCLSQDQRKQFGLQNPDWCLGKPD